MTSREHSSNTTGILRWFTPPKKKESTVISIRGIRWFSLLKLLIVGYAFGSLPFIVLLNYAAFSAPTVLSEEVKTSISFPAVLWTWPLAVFFAAWFTNFFVNFGLRIFGSMWPLRIAVFLDERKESNQSPEPTAPSGRGSS